MQKKCNSIAKDKPSNKYIKKWCLQKPFKDLDLLEEP